MDAKLKKRWTSALRSGQYEQDESGLKSPQGHCCLGVLADLIDPLGWKDDDVEIRWHGDCEYLPDSDAKKIGLNESIQRELAQMNDDWVAFPEIADWIEENL